MDWLKLALRKGNSFSQLDRGARGLVLQALVLLLFVALSLKTSGLKVTQNRLGYWLPAQVNGDRPNEDEREQLERVRAIAQSVRIAAKYCQPWAKCLQKSLVLWSLLTRQGIESDLRIGVRRESGEFQAHAWVEWQGFALNDARDVRDRYSTFEHPIQNKSARSV
ncbi:lasso peptide biosynthesis B2 protein [Roseofilum casamattae]|uniref:Lasso peptide biosynthesis B2 protein n=1 Tax=Roseofilum casamattae BLCC-M143 TaxID=3022442 RepID=A0ABT7BY46_9CYAN|nr:lasso peptide biosynthesis B2 protein [Roseofilum casamattae]MDJ1184128.1 lasso peptide biosynthesis B2 protein [Roseofilum casamattae BLCC-M143]